MHQFFTFAKIIVLIAICSSIGCRTDNEKPIFTKIIANGKSENAIIMGNKWKEAEGYIHCSGTGDNFNNMAYSSFFVNDADFHTKIKMSFDTINETTSIFWFFNNHFGFDSASKEPANKKRAFIYTPKYDSLIYLQHSKELFTPGKPFLFEVIRSGDSISFFIDKKLITKQPEELFSSPLQGAIGIRPWKNQIKIYDWEILGDLEALPEIDFVFENGEAGYACFRVPSIIQTTDGSILAFAEGRQNSCRDNFDVDILMKKSTDNGKTWSEVKVIWNDNTNTCCYPVPVVDKVSGRVALLTSWNLHEDMVEAIVAKESKDTRRVFLFVSEDNGENWSERKEITGQVKLPHWDYYAVGSGSGIQFKHPKHKNRMVAACHFSWHDGKAGQMRSNLIYSDDGGLNWSIGGITPEAGYNECEVAEISNGGLMINMRTESTKTSARSVAYSYDGGFTLQDQHLDDELFGPSCQASLDSYIDGNDKTISLFLGPLHKYSRENLVLQKSMDDGKSWEKVQTIFKGYSGYSDLLIMNDGQIGCFFECGKIWYSDGLAFKKLELPD